MGRVTLTPSSNEERASSTPSERVKTTFWRRVNHTFPFICRKQEAPGQLCLPCSKWRKRDKIINIFKRVKNHKLLQYSGKWHNMLKISTEKARKLQTFRHSLRQCGGPYLTKCHLKTSTEVSSF